MDSKHTVRETNLPGLKLLSRGKVRDIYDLGDDLLIVTTDRISAFDVVMDDPIPDKGKILTRISAFWFEATDNIIRNHMISTDAGVFPPACQTHRDVLEGRTMLVRKAQSPFLLSALYGATCQAPGGRNIARPGQSAGKDFL